MLADDEALRELRAGERGRWWRGRQAGAPLLIQRLRAGDDAAALAALQRECAVVAALSCAATLRPRVIDAPPRLVLQDPGGEPPAGRLAIDAVVALGMQIAATLAELHRNGLVHHGVRPEAMLWNAAARQAWLIDFADAAAPAARPAPPASVTPERLVYLAPEQSGRIDRGTDARSDLYALGVVLYELLSGAPPFRSADPLAQIHWHIAGHARPVHEIDAAIPLALSAIVMKLLAKTPDERYQSARGLAHDLALCAGAARRDTPPFALGRRDLGARLEIAPRLYGRERELHALHEAFEQACAGRGGGRMLLVEGYSGIGKTALIQQLVRPILRRDGHFISGKFDQLARGVPFGALIQAFRGLVRQLLGESEEQLAGWRGALLGALGTGGGVLAEVIPEIEFIIGAQPAPAALGATEAHNRFQRVLQNFLAALAQPEHPLVLFLDDLQWADAATLALLEPLLASPDLGHLMLMGAYRDHELDASPRLAHTLAALAASGAVLTRIALGPLGLPELTCFVADTLHGSAAQAAPLAQWVLAKTGGNPLFAIEFMKLLEREGHLRLDEAEARWVYRIESIAAAAPADSVIELMSRSIRRLRPKSQYTLTLAACIGNRFDLRTLAVVSEQSPAAAQEDLKPAVAEGLIVVAVAGDEADAAAFDFVHDRVQQAAYALIPAERREVVHLTVGRLLFAQAASPPLDAGLFDVVHHLNLGRGLIRSRAERREVAALNLAAGRRAKSSTAHVAALELFAAGAELLAADAERDDHELWFALHLEAAECRYLCGQSEAALRGFAELIAAARTPTARANVMRLRSVQYENMARYADALASAREAMALLGVTLPEAERDKAAALEAEIATIDALLGGREIAALVDLPVMADARIRMAMALLTGAWSAAYIVGDATLSRLISATMVRLSLVHGNLEESAYGYVTHAITIGPVRGEYAAAYAYGRLALAVNERFADTRQRAKICQQFHAHVALWCRPFASCAAYAREACRSGLESGDFLYAAYGAATEPWPAVAATADLAQFVAEVTPSVALVEKLNNRGFADSVQAMLAWARALQTRSGAAPSLGDAEFDEDAYLRRYRDSPFFSTIHAVLSEHLAVLLATPAQALAAAQHAAGLIHHLPGTVWPVIHDFWRGMALAACVDDQAADARDAWLAQLAQAQARQEALAAHCAENFRSQALLLGAEIARAQGRERDALAGYEGAIEFAATSASLRQYEALAHERLARYRLQCGQDSLAAMHLAQAVQRYAQWGAAAKVAALQQEFAHLLAAPRSVAPPAVPPAPAPAAPADAAYAPGLDLFSVVKAAQAIAGEVEFAALFARLMHIAIENAGAERGALVLESDAGPVVFAAAAGEDDDARAAEGVALAQSDAVAASVVNYVRRTAEDVVLAQADAAEPHASDAYVLRHRPRSVVCVPVRAQGRAIGVLYLEHRRAGGVFTPQRLQTLRVLAAQAAIAVENARLVGGLKREIAERRQAQDRLAAALAEVGRLKEDLETENSYLRRDLIANVSHDLRTPLVAMRGYLELLAAKGEALAPEQRAQYLGIAVRQSEHLATLIDELFELAKLDFKGARLEREAFPFGELASDVVQKFQLAAEQRQVALHVDAPARLPFVDADLSLIERVLENLIGNALRHTPEGGRVTLALRADGERLVVEVADTGRGIEKAELPFVFDRFYRGQGSRTAASGGAGLGLAITKRILELHGTTIAVASDAGRGTCFTFGLPLLGAPH